MAGVDPTRAIGAEQAIPRNRHSHRDGADRLAPMSVTGVTAVDFPIADKASRGLVARDGWEADSGAAVWKSDPDP
jgi:hypothetical protein